jgi:hypothetical protein
MPVANLREENEPVLCADAVPAPVADDVGMPVEPQYAGRPGLLPARYMHPYISIHVCDPAQRQGIRIHQGSWHVATCHDPWCGPDCGAQARRQTPKAPGAPPATNPGPGWEAAERFSRSDREAHTRFPPRAGAGWAGEWHSGTCTKNYPRARGDQTVTSCRQGASA